MIITEEDYLAHYGILRKSGRYPWGSGSTQSARNRSFLDTVDSLRKTGMTEVEIAKGFDMTTTQLRALKSIANTEQKQAQIRQAQRLHDRGWSNIKIGERMSINESSVRSLLAPGRQERVDILEATAGMLRDQVDKKGLIDIGTGVERDLPLSDGGNIGISDTKLKTAVAMLKEEGYTVHNVKFPQIGTGQLTTMKVLAKPGTTYGDVVRKRFEIQPISEFSKDGGRTYEGIKKPLDFPSKRVGIKYAKDGGSQMDGVIELRPGVKDLDMGASRYAQVRIAVDGTHYLKGMAIYNKDLPAGIDIQFNTNKSDTGNKLDAMKKMEPAEKRAIALNPFGATIKLGGQKGFLNIVNEEGDWAKHRKILSAQVLSKQSNDLAKAQLGLMQENRRKELDEILSLTNPTVRKKLLESFSDDTDSTAVHLEAAHMRGQATKVLLPVNSVKSTEIYAPDFTNGERVALIRFPHSGPFEIPELTVNNRNTEARRMMGNAAKDAVGINSKVAERLSGADFDGDFVLVIPNTRGDIKSTPALEGLKGFDPQHFKVPNPPPIRKQFEMGQVTNLIADMTIGGANSTELARAVRHSMVVIDAEKHGLDYKASAKENGIPALKALYQGSSRSGASTLITKARSEVRVNERKPRPAKDGGPIDKATGKKVYVDTGRTYVDRKTGEVKRSTISSKKLAETDNAHTLSSGSAIETIYADHSNRLKSLANTARKEMVNTKTIPYSKSAKQVYSKEVQSLNAKLNNAKKNAPLERHAQRLANETVTQKRQANPHMDSADLKKAKNQALNEARARTGANKQRVEITKDEWNAIQAGAISNHKLNEILNNSDLDTVKKLATPREAILMNNSKTALAKLKIARGYTLSEVAADLGVSLSTLKTSLD